jgi:outer membrane biosynthesis protein TonB
MENNTVPIFTGNSSKILNYLQVPQQVFDNFPEDIKEFVAIIEGSQEIYSESVDSNQKEKLAELIVTWMRQLMEFLQTQNLGIYGKMNVKLEQQTLPQNDVHALPPTPQPPTQTPPPAPPQPKQRTPKPKPEPPAPPTPPEPPTPSQQEHQPPFTKEELEDAIASAEIMAEIGDEDGIKDLKDLRSLYNRYYS